MTDVFLYSRCVVRAVCSLWRVALRGGWRGKANGRRSVLGFRRRGAAAGELVAILVMSDNLASHARCWSIRNPSDDAVAAGFFMTRWLAAGSA